MLPATTSSEIFSAGEAWKMCKLWNKIPGLYTKQQGQNNYELTIVLCHDIYLDKG